MTDEIIRILLIEDKTGEADKIQKILEEKTSSQAQFRVISVNGIEKGIHFVKKADVDLALLDLSSRDGQGLETFRKFKKSCPEIPVVILSALNDEELAVRTVHEGAQDYLSKEQIEKNLLARVIRYSIERHRAEMTLRDLALLDELTGLYNRRGFNMLVEQQMTLARRRNRKLLLMIFDLNDFKSINDRFGHAEGDRALKMAAAVLKQTFRSSDLIARIGGDEFAVASVEFDAAVIDKLTNRIETNLEGYNRTIEGYQISFAIGYSLFETESQATVETLMKEADRMLYEDKTERKTHLKK